MPIYEYTCKVCNARFEQLQRSMGSSSPAKCPECGSTRTARALSVFAVGAEQSRSQPAPAGGSCGRCGGAPGSCAFE
jgi:putative FmdB family regulatory protein